MKWMNYWLSYFFAALFLLFAFSPCFVGAQEVTLTEAEYAELMAIFDQLDETAERQSEELKKMKSELSELKSNLKQQSETISRLNSSLSEAVRSLREERSEATRDKIIIGAVALAGGFVGGLLLD